MTDNPESEKLRECPLCKNIAIVDDATEEAIRRQNTRPPSQYREALAPFAKMMDEYEAALVALGDTREHSDEEMIACRIALGRLRRAREAYAALSPQGDGWVKVTKEAPLPCALDDFHSVPKYDFLIIGGGPMYYRRATREG